MLDRRGRGLRLRAHRHPTRLERNRPREHYREPFARGFTAAAAVPSRRQSWRRRVGGFGLQLRGTGHDRDIVPGRSRGQAGRRYSGRRRCRDDAEQRLSRRRICSRYVLRALRFHQAAKRDYLVAGGDASRSGGVRVAPGDQMGVTVEIVVDGGLAGAGALQSATVLLGAPARSDGQEGEDQDHRLARASGHGRVRRAGQ